MIKNTMRPRQCKSIFRNAMLSGRDEIVVAGNMALRHGCSAE
jgi:hypothetical protein